MGPRARTRGKNSTRLHQVEDRSHTGWKFAERSSSALRATSVAMKRANSSGVSATA
jgi:hypothetical protein